MDAWVGFDLDGTLAHYESWGDGSIGAPIPPMVEMVHRCVSNGYSVRIVTARVGPQRNTEDAMAQRVLIETWCRTHLGFMPAVTHEKDFAMVALFDDRAIAVEKNTGRILGCGVEL